MKYTITILILMSFSLVYSQDASLGKAAYTPTEINPISIYKKTYELKNYVFTNGDSTILESLNIDDWANLREEFNDIEHYNTTLNKIIIVYSHRKIIALKNSDNDNLNEK